MTTLLVGVVMSLSNIDIIAIGISPSFFDGELSDKMPQILKAIEPICKSRIGVDGHFSEAKTVEELATDITRGYYQLGLMRGIEYASIASKAPKLKPFVVLVNQKPYLKAFLLVRADDQVKDFAGLIHRRIVLSKNTRAHCATYLNHLYALAHQMPNSLVLPDSEDVVDWLVDKKAGGAVVDWVALERYKGRKPERWKGVRVLCESELLPTSVLLYCPEGHASLSPALAASIKAKLLKVHENKFNRTIMDYARFTAFQEPPKDYIQVVEATRKEYCEDAKTAGNKAGD